MNWIVTDTPMDPRPATVQVAAIFRQQQHAVVFARRFPGMTVLPLRMDGRTRTPFVTEKLELGTNGPPFFVFALAPLRMQASPS